MSWQPATDPLCTGARDGSIDLVVAARPREYPGLTVRRTLPSARRRHVGPFVFLDHMGPAAFAPGRGIDVAAHPHIGLATLTYLFEGALLHRDGLGSVQTIRPGDVNWMSAGSGIVHSERTPAEDRRDGARVHGLQAWVALPRPEEESAPSFEHHAAATIPSIEQDGVALRVVAGSAFGVASPVRALSPLFYVEAVLGEGASVALPEEYAERAAYIVEGAATVGAERFEAGTLVVFKEGASRLAALARGERQGAVARGERDAPGPTRVVLLGGAPLDGERFIEWNFVSSSRERIERAKRDWRERRFALPPGDDEELVPLP